MALEEAAYIDGCTRTQTFFKIVFPLLKPIISTMGILNALAFWNDFLLPSLVLSDKKLLTLPLSTYSFYGTYSADYGTIMAGLLLRDSDTDFVHCSSETDYQRCGGRSSK